MDQREIRPVESSRAAGRSPERRPHAATEPARHDQSRSERDSVQLTSPQPAVLALLRERVLACTLRALGVAAEPRGEPRFALPSTPSLEVFVGRLFSEQNLLASRSRPHWSLERIHLAQERGFADGFAETMDILEDVHGLGEAAWTLLSAVLAEFQRKLASAASP